MDDNDKNSSQEPKSDKMLRLDLREAWIEDTDDDDDIIELKDEIKLPPKRKEAKVDRKEQMTADLPSDEPAAEKIIALDSLGEETDDQKSVIRLADDLVFEEEDRDEAKIPSPVSEPILKADTAGDVVEITEFDDVLSEDNNALVTLSDIAEKLEPEEEFLELIDVEEDGQPEDDNRSAVVEETEREDIEDEIIQFDGPAADAEDVELEDFINDSLGEEIRVNDDFEDELTSALGIEAGPEIKMDHESSESEDFDFSMDSSEISEKIEQLDTIFFDDSEPEDEFDEDAELETGTIETAVAYSSNENADEEREAGDLELPAEPPEDVLPAASVDAGQDQIDKSIERIITQNFSDKIESMIREIIEKTVSQEIDRLKNILLEDSDEENL